MVDYEIKNPTPEPIKVTPRKKLIKNSGEFSDWDIEIIVEKKRKR